VTEAVLTFAELAFLLGDDQQKLGSRLRLMGWPPEGEVSASGLASLAVRGLLAESEGVLMPRADVSGLLKKATLATQWVEVALARADVGGGLQLFDGPAGRARVIPKPLGAFEFADVAAAKPLADEISSLVVDFLSAPQPGAVLLAVHLDAEAEQHELSFRSDGAGGVEMVEGSSLAAGIVNKVALADVQAAVAHIFVA